MCQGHNDCIHYGISFFRDAMIAAEELENERTISMAYAVRIRNAGKDDFNEFISELSAKNKETREDAEESINRLKAVI